MNIIQFDVEKDFSYHWCGTFIAPNEDWIHLTRNLTDYELIVVTEGTLYIADKNIPYTVLPGQYLLMPPTEHQYGYKSSSCTFYWMHFGYNHDSNDHNSFENSETDLTKPTYIPGKILLPVQGNLVSPDRIAILMKQLQDSDRRYSEISLNHYLCGAILSEIAVQSNLFRAYEDKNTKEQICQDIITYIDWHIAENIKVSEIAGYFGYNEKYFTTFFKQYKGISIKQYILQTKMEHAKATLTETNQPISQIAYSLGFGDAHNFTNAFKKVTGLNPTEYRTSYTKRQVFNV